MGERPAAETLGQVPFEAHIELLERFLAHREAIVERIQELLNAQRKPREYLKDRRLLSRDFEDCCFSLAGVTPEQSRLRGQLEGAHRAQGFKPREMPGMYNDLVDPAELMRRAFHLWAQTRWPGRHGRVHFAHTLFNVYLLRQLALLSMRVWDTGLSDAGDRLAQVQDVLDRLWKLKPTDQPVLVRDARTLIPVALSPATEALSPYFEVAERIAAAFTDDDRLEIQRTVVRMAGGHLRSYLHYYITQKGVSLDAPTLVQLARKSNALDFSLLIHGLVPLLEAYAHAVDGGDDRRLELADAIFQGIASDPDLFINRVDLLGAYSMVEHLFTMVESAQHAVYTALGRRHVALLEEYAALIARLSKPLHEDCRHFRPVDGTYSPFGALYGYSSTLLEHMALKTALPDGETRFALEDVFTGGNSDKLAWVSGWRQLPHVDPKVAALYAYPHSFAERIFERIEQSLRKRASEAAASAVAQIGRLFVSSGADPATESHMASIPELPLQYIGSSDPEIVAAQKARAYDPTALSSDRLEGYFLLSYETLNGWVVISKDLLTEVLADGRDVKLVGLPDAAAEVLHLMCRDLVSR